jgi:hypothetical protein
MTGSAARVIARIFASWLLLEKDPPPRVEHNNFLTNIQ